MNEQITRTPLDAWVEKAVNYRFPRWDELPEIELYMDQVVSYLYGKLSLFDDVVSQTDENTMITATMINNYVKQKLIPPPVKKKYGRGHLSRLLMLFCVKQVLRIDRTGDFIAACSPEEEPEQSYNRFCSVFETVLHNTVAPVQIEVTGQEVYTMIAKDSVLSSVAISFASRLYAEHLLSSIKTHPTDKN